MIRDRCPDLQKIYLIVDHYQVHLARKVKEWGVEAEGVDCAFYLPRYSLELNPDESLKSKYEDQRGGTKEEAEFRRGWKGT